MGSRSVQNNDKDPINSCHLNYSRNIFMASVYSLLTGLSRLLLDEINVENICRLAENTARLTRNNSYYVL